MWPALFRSLPNTKTNGQQGFLKIGEEPDFPKVARLEPGVLFKRYELHKVQPLKVP